MKRPFVGVVVLVLGLAAMTYGIVSELSAPMSGRTYAALAIGFALAYLGARICLRTMRPPPKA